MAGIYIHIPFCKQKCHYCNFYSIVSIKNKKEFLKTLSKEILIQKNYLEAKEVNTIYLGGGTPSLLDHFELRELFDQLYSTFSIRNDAEITLEANPDDLDSNKLLQLKQTPINRLSIGVQSFFDTDLKYLNRIHSGKQAYKSVQLAKEIGFDNISLDLIYGIPTLSLENWEENLYRFFELEINHLSAYALTVEPKTPLNILIKKKMVMPVKEHKVVDHYKKLVSLMSDNDYQHYEVSSFCRVPFYSEHNIGYWSDEKYLGLGPSAHSYNGISRQWNVSSVKQYFERLMNNNFSPEMEKLSEDEKYNEYILTSLRTTWGLDLDNLEKQFGAASMKDFNKKAKLYINQGKLINEGRNLKLSKDGFLFADGISADLFK